VQSKAASVCVCGAHIRSTSDDHGARGLSADNQRVTMIQRGLARPVVRTDTDATPAPPDAAASVDASAPDAQPVAQRVVATGVQQREGRTRASTVEANVRAQLDARAKVSHESLDAARIATHDAVTSASARGADAVEITRVAHQSAADAIGRTSPHASKQERADAAMAAATFALAGGNHIKDLEAVDSGRTSMVKYMRDIAALNAKDGRREWTSPLDKTVGKGDLEPRFDDATDGQPFHVSFFTAAGYVASGNPLKQSLVSAAALYHETFDPDAFAGTGNTRADYVASMYGAAAGEQMKRARDRGDGELIPAMSVGLMAKDGVMPPAAGLSPERHAAAIAAARDVRAQRASWLNKAAVDFNPSANALIGAVQLAQKVWNR
jgi:hypothetical protein